MEVKPFLSIVLAGRNDNYGGDFKYRLQRCVSNLHAQLVDHNIPAEIIFVNYNPVSENSPIQSFISWPVATETVVTRIITIPAETHAKLLADGSKKKVPVLEYLAKNAGIVRAKGQYVLAMNPDIIIPSKVISEILPTKLKKDHFYRVDRVDFKIEGEVTEATEDIISQNSFKCYLKGFQYPMKKYTFSKLQFTRLFNRFRLLFHLDIIVALRYLFLIIGWKPNPHNAEFRYHCNVSGDFMLMHRHSWLKLRGNPENTFMSLHTDARMVIMAASSGLIENVLKYPIFHQDHSRRYDASQEADSEYRKVYLAFQSEAQEMIRNKEPKITNGSDWGLIDQDLPEILI